jgi:AcrR family transcriptional regulator
LTFSAVASQAGVQERTVYRYFRTKRELEHSVWTWIVENLTHAEFTAESVDDLVEAMRRSFAGFDAGAGLIRAMLHSRQGLEIRRSRQSGRRAMFERCVDQAVPDAGKELRTRLAATLQLLYSATAWDQLHSFWGMDAHAAADTIETAIRLLLAGAGQDDSQSRRSTARRASNDDGDERAAKRRR